MDKPLEQMDLYCRKCGSSGIAVWEDVVSDFSHDRKLVSLSDGFYQRPLLGAQLPEIICDHCGTGQSPASPRDPAQFPFHRSGCAVDAENK